MTSLTMPWERVLSLDAEMRAFAANHYSRQTPDSPQLAPPGRRLYFVTPDRQALWASSQQLFAAPHRVGSWMNTFFRNEGAELSSDLILSAISATLYCWGHPPAQGFATEIDPAEVAGFFRRTREGAVLDWGYAYHCAGFEFDRWTKGGLLVLRLPPHRFPVARAPLGEFAWERVS